MGEGNSDASQSILLLRVDSAGVLCYLFLAGFTALFGITSEITESAAADGVLSQLKDLLSSKLGVSQFCLLLNAEALSLAVSLPKVFPPSVRDPIILN